MNRLGIFLWLVSLCLGAEINSQPQENTSHLNLQQNNRLAMHKNDSEYANSLFAPYDPDRHYVHVRYFEVGKLDFEHVRTPFVISCWILIAGLGKMAFHMLPRSVVLPESCLLIIIGIIVGAVLNACLGDIEAAHHLDPDMFFLFMLPPIIHDAGYFMPNRLFFDNLGTILMMAVAGTIFNVFAVGSIIYCMGSTGIYSAEVKLLDIFLFSTLISAVDPVAVLAVFEELQVNDVLYIVVFGESILNDAVTVGLYHMFEEYIETGASKLSFDDVGKGFLKFTSAALGGTLIGLIFGLATAFFTRFTHRARVMEPLLVFIMSYLAYLAAEVFHFSGILSMIFCGLMMKNYVISNVSAKSNTTIKYMTKMLSSSSETAIFMLLGVATVHNNHIWNPGFIMITLASCVFVRFAGVVVITWIVNKMRLHPITWSDAFIIGYGGLRGAVAFALVLLIDPHFVPEQQMFLSTTIVVVYFTMFLQGITIKPLVNKLGIKRSMERNLTMNERLHERALDHITAGVEDIIGQPYTYNFRQKFKQFDRKFFIPYLTRNASIRLYDPKILETYNNLIVKETLLEIAEKLGKPDEKFHWSMSESLENLVRANHNINKWIDEAEPRPHHLSYRRQGIASSERCDTNSLARSLVYTYRQKSDTDYRAQQKYRSLPSRVSDSGGPAAASLDHVPAWSKTRVDTGKKSIVKTKAKNIKCHLEKSTVNEKYPQTTAICHIVDIHREENAQAKKDMNYSQEMEHLNNHQTTSEKHAETFL